MIFCLVLYVIFCSYSNRKIFENQYVNNKKFGKYNVHDSDISEIPLDLSKENNEMPIDLSTKRAKLSSDITIPPLLRNENSIFFQNYKAFNDKMNINYNISKMNTSNDIPKIHQNMTEHNPAGQLNTLQSEKNNEIPSVDNQTSNNHTLNKKTIETISDNLNSKKTEIEKLIFNNQDYLHVRDVAKITKLIILPLQNKIIEIFKAEIRHLLSNKRRFIYYRNDLIDSFEDLNLTDQTIFRSFGDEKYKLINYIEIKYDNADEMIANAMKSFDQKLENYTSFLNNQEFPDSLLLKSILKQRAKYFEIIKMILKENDFIPKKPNFDLNEDDKIVIYYISMLINKFFEEVSSYDFIDKYLPELGILKNLYFKNIDSHIANGRKFHIGKVILEFTKNKLLFFNKLLSEQRNIKNNQNVQIGILELRIFYIHDILNFLNVKNIYIEAYMVLIYKYYLLSIENFYNNENEKSEIENIFNMSPIELFRKLLENFYQYEYSFEKYTFL
ncbi:hypothetical protein DMUE_4074 [Dictyocoela muelleri]|nr:hypothetical protein DMUE_4074 [Dictyocoela muelleri]